MSPLLRVWRAVHNDRRLIGLKLLLLALCLLAAAAFEVVP